MQQTATAAAVERTWSSQQQTAEAVNSSNCSGQQHAACHSSSLKQAGSSRGYSSSRAYSSSSFKPPATCSSNCQLFGAATFHLRGQWTTTMTRAHNCRSCVKCATCCCHKLLLLLLPASPLICSNLFLMPQQSLPRHISDLSSSASTWTWPWSAKSTSLSSSSSSFATSLMLHSAVIFFFMLSTCLLLLFLLPSPSPPLVLLADWLLAEFIVLV